MKLFVMCHASYSQKCNPNLGILCIFLTLSVYISSEWKCFVKADKMNELVSFSLLKNGPWFVVSLNLTF